MTTNSLIAAPEKEDTDLVRASLAGDRDAFEQIVSRYQAFVCSIAYSATGNLSLSEDLAQDTFLTAWQHLSELREPEQLRAWLRGIMRNLVGRSLRSQQREPSRRAAELDEINEPHAPDPLPSDNAISREEAEILWRSLEQIPETYREPLVLFYRENQSAEAVAHHLGISEDSVRQRLVRGRKLLHKEVVALVERALEKTSPQTGFTQGVMAALPMALASAKGATAGIAAAKGGAGLKSLFSLGALGGLVGIIGAIMFQWKIALDETKSGRERQFVRRIARVQIPFFALTLLAALFWLPYYAHRPLAFSIGLILLLFLNVIAGIATMMYMPQRQLQIRAEEGLWADDLPESEKEINHRAFWKAVKFSLPFLFMFAIGAIFFPWRHHWDRCLMYAGLMTAVLVWGFRRQYNLFRFKTKPSAKPLTGLRHPMVRVPAILLGAGLLGGGLGYVLPNFLYGQRFPHISTEWLRALGLSVLVAVFVYGGLVLIISRTRFFEAISPAFGSTLKGILQGNLAKPLLEKTYGPIFEQLNFSPERRKSFTDLILKKAKIGSQAGISLMGLRNNPDQREALLAAVKNDVAACDAEIQQLLGEADARAFREYEKSIPDRVSAKNLEHRCPGLNADTREQLLRAMSTARATYPWSTDTSRRNQSGANLPALLTKEYIETFAREEEAFERQLLQQARNLLDEAQVAAFEKILAQQRKSQVNQFKIAARMFGIGAIRNYPHGYTNR